MSTQNSKLLIWAACLGNLFEHYDTALFSLLSPFLASYFFPHQDPLTALILTYAIIPLGMLIRPFGALFFGYIGDSFGRKPALISSLVGMGIVSGFMGLMPTYSQVGMWAPILLSLGKTFQNFFAAGETVGGAIFLIENTDKKNHNFMSGIYSSSTIGGILLASAGVSILGFFGLIESGWRILYFIGCLTAFSGCILRFNIGYDEPSPKLKKEFIRNILRNAWEMKTSLFLIALASGFSYATYSMAFIMMNGFIPFVSNMSHTEVMHLNTSLLIIDFLTLPLFGLLANRFSREALMLTASLAAMFGGIPLFFLLGEANIWNIIFVRLCIVMIGVWFSATFYSWSKELVPKTFRYSLISFAYAIGSQCFGAPTAAISLWLYQKTGLISSACWYWIFLATVFSVILARELIKQTTSRALHTD